jgi:serine/threonine protein kinase
MKTCSNCGRRNEDTTKICQTCGQNLDESTTFIVQQQEGAGFGFRPTNIDFTKQGVDKRVAGQLTERFLPILHISTGGMGKLFLVQERLSGRYVALKVMLEEDISFTPYVHQFIREAVITARLQHPHIIPVHELGFLERNQLYYTMRYVDGNPLSEIIDRVDLEEKLRILRGAALAVDFAHKQGLWHRDLKPQNILVGQLGEPYVIDWGLVTVQPGRDYKLNLPRIVIEKAAYNLPDNLFEETRDAVTTSRGAIMGTPAYMAPEQFMGVDSRMGAVSDVWAFGIMLFEALTGQHPVRAGKAINKYEMMRAVLTESFPEPKEIVNDTHDKLNGLCQFMLRKEPEERMQSLEGFVDVITNYLKAHGQTVLGFGSFHGVAYETVPATLKGNKAINGRGRITDMDSENIILRIENERHKRKVELLSEITQLSWMDGKRKKELWRALAQV